MNVERLTVIRDYLRNPPKGFTQGFNMTHWVGVPEENGYIDHLGEPGECGTIHCIAGLANVFWGDDPKRDAFLFEVSRKILGLTDIQATKLFYAGNTEVCREDITVSMAIAAIEDLILTGTVVWDD